MTKTRDGLETGLENGLTQFFWNVSFIIVATIVLVACKSLQH